MYTPKHASSAVRYLDTCVSPIFMPLAPGTDVQYGLSVQNININSWEVTVKVQGENRRTESYPIAIALLWLEIAYLHQIS